MWYSTVGSIITLFLSLLAVPLAAAAQPSGKVYRIGYLAPAPPSARVWDALLDGLRERGYSEGRNLVFERRFSEGNAERFPGFAAELVRLRVDLIIVPTTSAALAVKNATQTIPIVFVQVGDPVGSRLVMSLARPGGNLTGLSLGVSSLNELEAKRLEMLKEAIPTVSRVAVLWHPDFSLHVEGLHGLKMAAQALRVELQPVAFRRPQDFEAGIAAMRQGGADALLVMGHPMTFNAATHLAELAVKNRLPAIFGLRTYAEAGGLMAYGANINDMYHRAAYYVDRILKGAKPADLPVEQPTKFELVINLKTAQALGITIPPTLLFLADEVIQ